MPVSTSLVCWLMFLENVGSLEGGNNTNGESKCYINGMMG